MGFAMNSVINKINNDKVLQVIKPFLCGIDSYLVGGYLRDLFLGKESFDRDIILLNVDVENLTRKIATEIGASFVELDKDWGIYRLVLSDKKNYIDFARAIDNDLEKDIKRRDITINSIAFNLDSQSFYDPNDGIKDIKNGIIRKISEKNFTDDALRLLRVFRFQSTLGFKIDDETKQIVKKHAELIKNPAKERVNTELLKLFEGDNTAEALNAMNEVGMLEIIFPFVAELKQIPPNSHHHLDLFNHSLETVKQTELIIKNLSENALNILNFSPYGSIKKLAYLKIGAFMHDIGKPATWTIDEETGRHRFIFHDSKGAELAPTYLKQLNFSKKQIAYIKTLIKNHIYPSNVNLANDKSVMKFLRKMDNDTVDIIVLAMADRLSARGRDITDEIVAQNINQLNVLMAKYFENLEALKPLPKLIDGHEIMNILGIKPSPLLGKIISALKIEQEEGNISNYNEAVAFIKSFEL